MCSIENKKLPSIDVSLLKMYIKDLTKDINTIQTHIDLATSTKNHLNRDLEIFLNEKMYALAKDKQKYIKKVSKRIDDLETAKQTIETIRLKYGNVCIKLRSLYSRKSYYEQKQRRKENSKLSNDILKDKLKNISSEIKSIQSEYKLY